MTVSSSGGTTRRSVPTRTRDRAQSATRMAAHDTDAGPGHPTTRSSLGPATPARSDARSPWNGVRRRTSKSLRIQTLARPGPHRRRCATTVSPRGVHMVTRRDVLKGLGAAGVGAVLLRPKISAANHTQTSRFIFDPAPFTLGV